MVQLVDSFHRVQSRLPSLAGCCEQPAGFFLLGQGALGVEGVVLALHWADCGADAAFPPIPVACVFVLICS